MRFMRMSTAIVRVEGGDDDDDDDKEERWGERNRWGDGEKCWI